MAFYREIWNGFVRDAEFQRMGREERAQVFRDFYNGKLKTDKTFTGLTGDAQRNEMLQMAVDGGLLRDEAMRALQSEPKSEAFTRGMSWVNAVPNMAGRSISGIGSGVDYLTRRITGEDPGLGPRVEKATGDLYPIAPELQQGWTGLALETIGQAGAMGALGAIGRGAGAVGGAGANLSRWPWLASKAPLIQRAAPYAVAGLSQGGLAAQEQERRGVEDSVSGDLNVLGNATIGAFDPLMWRKPLPLGTSFWNTLGRGAAEAGGLNFAQGLAAENARRYLTMPPEERGNFWNVFQEGAKQGGYSAVAAVPAGAGAALFRPTAVDVDLSTTGDLADVNKPVENARSAEDIKLAPEERLTTPGELKQVVAEIQAEKQVPQTEMQFPKPSEQVSKPVDESPQTKMEFPPLFPNKAEQKQAQVREAVAPFLDSGEAGMRVDDLVPDLPDHIFEDLVRSGWPEDPPPSSDPADLKPPPASALEAETPLELIDYSRRSLQTDVDLMAAKYGADEVDPMILNEELGISDPETVQSVMDYLSGKDKVLKAPEDRLLLHLKDREEMPPVMDEVVRMLKLSPKQREIEITKLKREIGKLEKESDRLVMPTGAGGPAAKTTTGYVEKVVEGVTVRKKKTFSKRREYPKWVDDALGKFSVLQEESGVHYDSVDLSDAVIDALNGVGVPIHKVPSQKGAWEPVRAPLMTTRRTKSGKIVKGSVPVITGYRRSGKAGETHAVGVTDDDMRLLFYKIFSIAKDRRQVEQMLSDAFAGVTDDQGRPLATDFYRFESDYSQEIFESQRQVELMEKARDMLAELEGAGVDLWQAWKEQGPPVPIHDVSRWPEIPVEIPEAPAKVQLEVLAKADAERQPPEPEPGEFDALPSRLFPKDLADPEDVVVSKDLLGAQEAAEAERFRQAEVMRKVGLPPPAPYASEVAAEPNVFEDIANSVFQQGPEENWVPGKAEPIVVPGPGAGRQPYYAGDVPPLFGGSRSGPGRNTDIPWGGRVAWGTSQSGAVKRFGEYVRAKMGMAGLEDRGAAIRTDKLIDPVNPIWEYIGLPTRHLKSPDTATMGLNIAQTKPVHDGWINRLAQKPHELFEKLKLKENEKAPFREALHKIIEERDKNVEADLADNNPLWLETIKELERVYQEAGIAKFRSKLYSIAYSNPRLRGQGFAQGAQRLAEQSNLAEVGVIQSKIADLLALDEAQKKVYEGLSNADRKEYLKRTEGQTLRFTEEDRAILENLRDTRIEGYVPRTEEGTLSVRWLPPNEQPHWNPETGQFTGPVHGEMRHQERGGVNPFNKRENVLMGDHPVDGFDAWLRGEANSIFYEPLKASYEYLKKVHPLQFDQTSRNILDEMMRTLGGERSPLMDKPMESALRSLAQKPGFKWLQKRNLEGIPSRTQRAARQAMAYGYLGYRASMPTASWVQANLNNWIGIRNDRQRAGVGVGAWKFFVDGEKFMHSEAGKKFWAEQAGSLGIHVDPTSGELVGSVSPMSPMFMMRMADLGPLKRSFMTAYTFAKSERGLRLNEFDSIRYARQFAMYSQVPRVLAALPRIHHYSEGRTVMQFMPWLQNQISFINNLTPSKKAEYFVMDGLLSGFGKWIQTMKYLPILGFYTREFWDEVEKKAYSPKVQELLFGYDPMFGLPGTVGVDLTGTTAIRFRDAKTMLGATAAFGSYSLQIAANAMKDREVRSWDEILKRQLTMVGPISELHDAVYHDGWVYDDKERKLYRIEDTWGKAKLLGGFTPTDRTLALSAEARDEAEKKLERQLASRIKDKILDGTITAGDLYRSVEQLGRFPDMSGVAREAMTREMTPRQRAMMQSIGNPVRFMKVLENYQRVR